MRGDIREILAALEVLAKPNVFAVMNMQSMSKLCVHKPAFERTCRIDPQSARADLRLFLNQWASVFHIKENTVVANARVFSSLIIRAMHY